MIGIRRVRSIKKGLSYVLKYVLKPPEFSSVEGYVQFLRAFNHKPRVVPLGLLRGCEEKGDERNLVCPECGSSSFVFVKLLYSREEAEEFVEVFSCRLIESGLDGTIVC